MGYSVRDIDIVKNYTKPGYGTVKLCRDILVALSYQGSHDAVPRSIKDVYKVSVHIMPDFGISIDSIERDESISGETTEYTPIDDVIDDLVYDYGNS